MSAPTSNAQQNLSRLDFSIDSGSCKLSDGALRSYERSYENLVQNDRKLLILLI